jgi:hydrogenase maturation protease
MAPDHKLLILGLGNPIVSDDAVGYIVVDELRKRIDHPGVTFETAQAGGLALLDVVSGYDHVIVIDAIKTGNHEPGEIIQFRPEDYMGSPRGTAAHNVSFFQALELGRRTGMEMPEDIRIVAIEIVDNVNIREELTVEVRKAVPKAVDIVRHLAGDMGFNAAAD